MSIMPLPDPGPLSPQTPDTIHAVEPIHFSSLDAYAGQPGAITGVSFWPRAGARLIDTAVHYVVGLCCGFFIGLVLAVAGVVRHNPAAAARFIRPGASFSLILFSLLGAVALETVCEGLHGSTLGKLLLGFVVVQEDGTACRMKSALIRSLAYFVDALFFGLIAYLAMQKTPQEQRHGDDWAHTIVCRRSDVAPGNLHSGGDFVMAFLLAVMADATLMIIGVLVKGMA